MKKTNFTSILPSWSWRAKASRWLVVTLFLAFGLSGAYAQTTGPNCTNLNLSVGSNDSVLLTAQEMVPNAAEAFPFTVTIKNEFGGTVFFAEITAADQVISFPACSYIGATLKADVESELGICWSELTIKQGNTKILNSNLDTSVWCLDPLVFEDPNDLSNLTWYTTDSPYTLLPTAIVPCGDDILFPDSGTADYYKYDTNGDSVISAMEARAYYHPRFEDCDYYAQDWTVAFPCEGTDTSKVIIREWEAFDKEGNRSTVWDTITVIKLPELKFHAPQKDTVHCYLDTMPNVELDPSFVCWKQIVGLHSEGNHIYYPMDQINAIIASINSFTGEEKEVVDQYIEDNPIIIQEDGTPILVTDTALLEDSILYNGKYSYKYGPVSRGDQFLTNGGDYITADEEWEYIPGSHGFWADFCIPNPGAENDPVVCDRWEEWKCEEGPLVILPTYPGSPETTGIALCMTQDILDATKCYTVMHTEIKELGGSCPRIVKKHFEVKQTCMATVFTNGADEGICIDENGDTTVFPVEDEGLMDPSMTPDGVYVIEQWKMYVDTLAPLLQDFQDARTWSAGSHDCYAEARVPAIHLKDDCSGVKEVKATVVLNGAVQGASIRLTYDEESGYWMHAESTRTVQLACGHYDVHYVALDQCHNADTFEYEDALYVVDNTPPTVITDDNIRVSLGGKDIWVDAERFDEGTTDNCGIRMILARRTDWAEACGVELCSDAIAEITTIEELHDFIDDYGYTATLTEGEVEQYYAEQYEWLKYDGKFCDVDGDGSDIDDNYVVHGWEQAILQYWAENCAPQDEHGNSVISVDYGATVGGGWAEAVPFCCADACEEVTVELLAIDKECNYSKGWLTVEVEDKSPVAKACEFDEITISCASYASTYAEAIDAAIAAGNNSDEAPEEFATVDELLGALMKGWRSADNQLVDEDGNEMDKTFEYITTACEYVIDTVKEFVPGHDGEEIWVTTYDTSVIIVPDTVEAQKGGAFVLCGARCEQDIWVELNDCGVGTITRRWQVFSGCSDEHDSNPLVYEQVINIVAGCELNKHMFDVPEETVVCTEGVDYDVAGNVVLPEDEVGSLVYALDDTDCRQLGIGYEDHVFEVAGQEGVYKIHRHWKVSDWCSGDEIECIQKIVIDCDAVEEDDADTTGSGQQSGNITGDITTEYNGDVQNVTVTGVLADGRTLSAVTGADGTFALDVAEGASVAITPAKNYDFINGVDIADIVRIQRHILGRQSLDGEFTLVAADVNNDGRVNGLDIIAIQQITLKKAESFPGNTSWRFFNTVSGEETYQISSVSAAESVNFTAVKIGDIDQQNVDLSRAAAANFVASDIALTEGQREAVTLTSPAVEGYQVALQYDADKVDVLNIAGVSAENWNVVNEGLILVSYAGDVTDLVVELAAKADANLSDVISLGSAEGFEAKAVAGDEFTTVGLEFASTDGFALFQNTPNPAVASTSIRFNLPTAGQATLSFFDVTGKVLQVISQEFAEGLNTVTVTSDEIGTTGVVYYQLETNEASETKRLVFIE